MTLKVIRYKNYGCTMTGGDATEYDKFYNSFYELNNGKIIELMLFQSFKDDKLNVTQYDFNYTRTKLKSGEIRDYKFGKAKAKDNYGMANEFFEWFDSSPMYVEVIDYFVLNEQEEKCVKDFYLKRIELKKDIKTDTIVTK
jgi:hypothetical protein